MRQNLSKSCQFLGFKGANCGVIFYFRQIFSLFDKKCTNPFHNFLEKSIALNLCHAACRRTLTQTCCRQSERKCGRRKPKAFIAPVAQQVLTSVKAIFVLLVASAAVSLYKTLCRSGDLCLP